MAYYRRSTPASRRTTVIILAVMVLIMVIIGLSQHTNYKKITSRCTAYEVGSVTDVDSQRVYRRRGGSYTKYRAEVTLIAGNQLGKEKVFTDWTRHAYYRGDAVRVFYDPSDPSLYYVDGAGPEDGMAMFITSGILAIFGVITFIQAKRSA